jgi:hypothetical protein|eukprot:SAG31_NODE_4097_length_3590_cov_3.464353_8_plen_56_part_00
MDSIGFFHSIPDDVMIEIALKDWKSLEALCQGLAIDLQLLKEEDNESISNRRNVC